MCEMLSYQGIPQHDFVWLLLKPIQELDVAKKSEA